MKYLLFFQLFWGTLLAQVQYEVYAIEFASLQNKITVSGAAIGSKSTDSTGVSYMVWLLKGNNGKIILVDAGFTDKTINPNINYVRPDSALRKMDIYPDDITDIIVTHPHWDHIGGINLFPNAMVWMQQNDYDYFVGTAWQKNGNSTGFNKEDVTRIVKRNLDKKLKLIAGDDVEIMPGIKVFIGSKHTFESQYVLVSTKAEKVIIASDNTWFYYNLINDLAIPVTMDSKAYIKNLKRMKKQVSNPDLIIPGHDPLVFSKFPKIAEGVVQISK